MSDEIRVTRDDAVSGARPARGEVRPTGADAARQTPTEANAGTVGIPEYDDPELARAEIEATRSRMSETINEIEDVLVRRKERIQNKLDVLSPIKANPWPAMGIALGAGIVFGLLTGGDDDEVTLRGGGAVDRHDWERRAGMLHSRTHRLLDIARDQEDELRRLRRKRRKHRRSESLLDHFWGDDDDLDDEGLLGTISSKASDWRSSAGDFRDTLGSRTSDWRDALGSRTSDWRDTLGSAASDWRSTASDLRDTLAERLSDFLDSAARQMKKRR